MGPNERIGVTNRLTSVDVTRGLVMVIMALDHVRELLHISALTQDPTDLTTTTPALFMTRWITHLCAPIFVFLSGLSAYLSLRKRQDEPSRWFLLKRGVVLILLELTIINFAFWFDIQFRTILLQVIYAIGGGLIVVALLARVPARWIGWLGAFIVFAHSLSALVPPFSNMGIRFVWSLLFRSDLFTFSPSFTVFVAYPLIPWLGIMLVGFGFGPLMERSTRQRRLLQLGLGALLLFVLLRFLDGYGDPRPWVIQKDGLLTLLSFINVSKYPPSLAYSLLMVGIGLLLLAVTDGARNGLARLLVVYGKVPMFYYILHWYLVHLSMIGMVLWQGYPASAITAGTMNFGRPAGAGISLEMVYVVWLGLVVLLYLPCRWYGRYKINHPEIGWLRYV